MGPLTGIRVVEFAGIGPGPFCAMMLADAGADVIRIDPVTERSADYTPNIVLERGRRSIAIDLKHPDGAETALRLIASADVVVESFRPGVMERLRLGPGDCLAVNPRLVYGRMTGYGQDGPMAGAVGHDINYISLTGALHAIGRLDSGPVPPLNLVGDFGGGAMFLAYGIACALVSTRASGRGQVVDANVLDGTTTLLALVHGLRAAGKWHDERGANLLDTGAPFYDVYRCSDGQYVAVGCIEEKFFLELLTVLGLVDSVELRSAHKDQQHWPALRAALTQVFSRRKRDEWVASFVGHQACVTPVLTVSEAPHHEQALARESYQPIPGNPAGRQPAPAPRFSETVSELPPPPVPRGADTDQILADLGLTVADIGKLRTSGAVA
jgi:alpha-methylacyl-CoA racemase